MLRIAAVSVLMSSLAVPVALAADGTAPATFAPASELPAPVASADLYERLTRLVEEEIARNDRQHIGTPNPFLKPRARPSRLPRPAVPMS